MAKNVRRIALAAAVVLALVLIAAWIDGGEVPLRTIVQPVPLPQGL